MRIVLLPIVIERGTRTQVATAVHLFRSRKDWTRQTNGALRKNSRIPSFFLLCRLDSTAGFYDFWIRPRLEERNGDVAVDGLSIE